MTISASLVKKLREHTGAGMMECKKALEKANGNLEEAITIMRKAGQAKAAKKTDRIAAEGIIIVKNSTDHRKAAMLEINSETDFVARDTSFLEFAQKITQAALDAEATNLTQFLETKLDNGKTVAKTREELVNKIGENINIRRLKTITATSNGVIGNYVHNNQRIGVLVELSANNFELAKDVAMHIAACKPLALIPQEIPKELLEKERSIYLAQLSDSNKPPEIIEKIVSGKIQKFVNESVLIKHPFVKNPDVTIEDLLKEHNADISSFVRFEVGEGIEKKEINFASEVKAQVKSKK